MKILPFAIAALRALRVNKLRASLTMLGIIIGVAAVIATVAIGQGATERVQQQIASVGSNLILVLPGSLTQSGMRLGAGNALTLSEDDARAVARECGAVAAVAPTVRGGAQVVFGNNNWGTIIQGVTPDYLVVRDLSIDKGEAFTQQDVDTAAKVAILGPTVVDKLFASNDPVGQFIRIKNVPVQVAGVLVAKGQSPSGQDQDDVILVPLSTAKKKILGIRQANAGAIGAMLVEAQGPAMMNLAQDQIRDLLRQRHHIQPGQDDDFSVRNLEELFRAQESSAQIMSFLLAAVASVSLLVGGIGIMNIMLVSVSERTREIGLRQAVGAKTKHILSQFLVEAAVLSLVGGTIGIGVGVAMSVGISHWAGWATLISPFTIAGAFVFSALVGVTFGYYPAHKAAFLNPIEALRFE
jgi:putative ABC transport system permease protein